MNQTKVEGVMAALEARELKAVDGGLVVLGGSQPLDEGMIFINRGGWTCGTFDPHHGLPGSPSPQVPNW
jgi:hypothetical protein